MPLRGLTFLEVGVTPSVSAAGDLLALLGATVVRLGGPPAAGRITLDGDLDAPPSRLDVDGALVVADAAGEAQGGLAGAPFPVVSTPADPHPALDWAAIGALALTGAEPASQQPPSWPAGWHAARLRGAALAAQLLAGLGGGRLALDGPALITERAALSGLVRRGAISAGGATRLLPSGDGQWIAVALARPEDIDAIPAWLGVGAGAAPDPWPAVTAAIACRPAGAVVEEAQLLGIPAALARRPDDGASDAQLGARGQTWPPAPWLIDGRAPRLAPSRCLRAFPARRPRVGRSLTFAPTPARALVVDLSSLWAGPLCSRLLADAGAGIQVEKIEGAGRPDGARRGPPAWWSRLNGGKSERVIDFSSPYGAEELRGRLQSARLVIEASRPRVMDGLGILPENLRETGTSWVAITGYGRLGPWRDWVAFGDDAAAAGGALVWDAHQHPMFCADAYADPVAGLLAAVAALAVLVTGEAHVVDVAMREAVAWVAQPGEPVGPAAIVRDRQGGWGVHVGPGRRSSC